jgi:hypothetical protein
VRTDVSGNEKAAITVLAFITSDGTKLALYLMACGEAKRAKVSQLGNGKEDKIKYPRSGWSTMETMKQELMWLWRHCCQLNIKSDLILDVYRGHLQVNVIKKASALNSELHVVPGWMTDIYKPLNLRAFHSLVVSGGAEHRKVVAAHHHRKARSPDAVQKLFDAWGVLATSTVEDIWAIFEGPDHGVEQTDLEDKGSYDEPSD